MKPGVVRAWPVSGMPDHPGSSSEPLSTPYTLFTPAVPCTEPTSEECFISAQLPLGYCLPQHSRIQQCAVPRSCLFCFHTHVFHNP